MSEDALEGFLEPLWNGDEYYWKYFLLVRSYVGFLAAADNELLDDELSSRCEAMRRSFDLLFDFIAYNFFPFGEKDATERLVMHPRLNVDRGGSGDPKDMSEYWRHQKKLYQIVNGAYESWREFRRAVKRTLVV
jgi:hypothetical protein